MKTKRLFAFAVAAFFILSGVSLAHAQVFTENLYYGLQDNSQVSQLQEFLSSQNLYSGPISGNFYFLTLNAVKAFQTQQGITPAAGYFGPLTIAAANKIADAEVDASNAQAISEMGTSTPPTQASSSTQVQIEALLQQVTLLQQELQTKNATTTTPPVVTAFDACMNISGIQPSVPNGMYGDGKGDCFPIPTNNVSTPTSQNIQPQTQSQGQPTAVPSQPVSSPSVTQNNAPSCTLTGVIQSIDQPNYVGEPGFNGANVGLSWTFSNMPYSSTTPGTLDSFGIENGTLIDNGPHGHLIQISPGQTSTTYGFDPIYKASFSNAAASVTCYAFFPDYWNDTSISPNVGDVSTPIEPYAFQQYSF